MLLDLLNFAFGTKYGCKMDFIAEQPKIRVSIDEYMSKHIGVLEDSKLVSVLGVYSLPVKILSKKFLFITNGLRVNVKHPTPFRCGVFFVAF